jgi:hypothetical protein
MCNVARERGKCALRFACVVCEANSALCRVLPMERPFAHHSGLLLGAGPNIAAPMRRVNRETDNNPVRRGTRS